MIRPKGFWPRLWWRFDAVMYRTEPVAIVSWLSLETIEAAARSIGLRW